MAAYASFMLLICCSVFAIQQNIVHSSDYESSLVSELANDNADSDDQLTMIEQPPPSLPSSSSGQQQPKAMNMAECHLRPVIHILQRAGCIPKPIPSFACYGTCNSYVQVSNSKFWQVERSCNCCQEIGEREASVMLHCPKQTPNYRKVTTRAPVECLCRPCTAVDEHLIQPLEMAAIHHDTTGSTQPIVRRA